MSTAPEMPWPDLDYVDTEQVELDVHAIIARGTRLRRRRLVTKAAAVALVMGVAPAVIIADMASPVVNGSISARHGSVPGVSEGLPEVSSNRHAESKARFGWYANAPSSSKETGTGFHDASGGALMYSVAHAQVRRAATLSKKNGPLLAVAGARAGGGLWFTATSAQLTLFHLSLAGALRSWALPTPAAAVRKSDGAGLAVTTAGVAWVGVGSTVLSLDTKTSRLSTWHLPARHSPGHLTTAERPTADSLAVSLDGQVAVATSSSSSVQVLDPRSGRFRTVSLPEAADRPLAVGYARDGTLGIGYRRLGEPRAGAVLLVKPSGAERSAPVAQPTAVTAYGSSRLLVGVTKLDVVPASGRERPLLLPADSPDLTSVTTPPASLPGDRLGIAMDTAILTFPATTTSATIATAQSELWITAQPWCQPRHGCPGGYRLMATDDDGDMWVVPKADPRTVELVSLR
jgi:streptogramin lyase